MKLSLNWLKDYIDPKLSTDELAHRLVMAGWEVEAVETHDKDTVFELEITPNRPDCLNILGLAREIGAITSKRVNYPKISKISPTKNKISISIEDKKDCGCYIATLIQQATISNSTIAIQEKLSSVGLKAISNAVDVTNFVLMEQGQPLHAFDYDKVQGGKIVVRRAKQGEKIVTIDGIERQLDPSILVIADTQKPIAIAGIMGGKETEVTASTKNVLLEAAHFDMTLVRRASRKLGLRSDSSYRFERNVNIEGVLMGANRATDLIIELTKGKVTARSENGALKKKTLNTIKISAQDVENRLGNTISTAQIKKFLTALEFKVSGTSTLNVVAPSFRGDVKQKVDLIEEVARIIGFDRLPTSLPMIKAKNSVVSDVSFKTKKLLRETMRAQGLNETVTLSMVSSKDLQRCGQENIKHLKVYNPLSSEQEIKRPSLLPSLLKVAATNIHRGNKDLKLFEIAKRYSHEGEHETLAVLLTGRRSSDWRISRKESVEIYDLKGVVQATADSFNINLVLKGNDNSINENGLSASIYLDNQEIGFLGKIKKDILNNWDIKNNDIFYLSINLEKFLNKPKQITKFKPLVEFPSVTRDVSLSVAKEVTYASIEEICRSQQSGILKEIVFIEQYQGEKIAQGQKALIFSLVYQSNKGTLREEEVNTLHENIVKDLSHQLGAQRR